MNLRTALVPAALALTAIAGTAIHAQATQRVAFARGNDNASVSGTVRGSQYKDYLLGARAGQSMSVSLITRGNAYFNILPPRSNDVAIYNSSANGNDAVNIALPATGDYKIRVYLMGNAKSANRTVSYQLSMTVMN